MAKKGTEPLVGIFILLSIMALAFLALKAANLASFSAAKTYTVRARFDNVGGQKPNAPVCSAGVSVGQVTSITLDQNTYQGLVVMKINEGMQFPVDSSAKIFTAGLLGDQYVGIEPGSDDKNLANNDLIKPTQSALVLENLIGQLIFNKAADDRLQQHTHAGRLAHACDSGCRVSGIASPEHGKSLTSIPAATPPTVHRHPGHAAAAPSASRQGRLACTLDRVRFAHAHFYAANLVNAVRSF